MKTYFGEFVGTFLLVFIGCGTVALDILFGTFGSLNLVALVWGIGVALAIFATRNICPAHLNPAVSIGMSILGKLEVKKLPFFLFAQFAGAFAASGILYLIFSDALIQFELTNSIVRGTPESIRTAAMFGEFFPNPGFSDIQISWIQAALLECTGTFALVLFILLFTEKLKLHRNAVPLLIGLTVCFLIILIAPYTQAGLNPARDFGPRLFASLLGWGEAAFPLPSYSFLTVYILGPIAGGAAIAWMFRTLKIR